jgi:hypothetical protein
VKAKAGSVQVGLGLMKIILANMQAIALAGDPELLIRDEHGMSGYSDAGLETMREIMSGARSAAAGH